MSKRICEISVLPERGVTFLGGHPNMTKKLKQQYPRWNYISDEQFSKRFATKNTIIFYWTKHSSHKLMQYVYSKLPDDANILYVTATNLALLIEEMECTYQTLVS